MCLSLDKFKKFFSFAFISLNMIDLFIHVLYELLWLIIALEMFILYICITWLCVFSPTFCPLGVFIWVISVDLSTRSWIVYSTVSILLIGPSKQFFIPDIIISRSNLVLDSFLEFCLSAEIPPSSHMSMFPTTF